MTWAQCADTYCTKMLGELKNDKHRKQWRTTLEETFKPMGGLPIADITNVLKTWSGR